MGLQQALETRRDFSDFNPQGLANTAWACYMLKEDALLMKLISTMGDVSIGALDEMVATQWRHVFLYIEHILYGQVPQWVQSLPMPSEGTISKHQRACKNILEVLGYAPEMEYNLSGIFVDIFFQMGERNIIIELDGSQHYLTDGSLRLKDRKRDEILEAMGFTVFRLRNEECNEARIRALIE